MDGFNIYSSEHQHKKTPDDLIIAHDLGLAHYWQAKRAGSNSDAISHWKRVIANWSLILESNRYWDDWKTQRQDVYGTNVTDQDTKYVRDRLHDQLRVEFPISIESDSGTRNTHLEARYFLERRALRLIRETEGFQLDTGPLYAGPLLINQLDRLHDLAGFFAGQPVYAADSLQIILAYAAPENRAIGDLARALRIAFSDLGIVAVHLSFEDVSSAHDFMKQLKCPHCTPAFADIPDLIADYLLTPCEPGCEWFAETHPSYAAIPGGTDLYFQDAAEMLGGSYILRANQSLRGTNTNATSFANNVAALQACGQLLQIDEQRLDQQLADLVEENLNYLESKEDLDGGIALVNAIQPVLGTNGTWDAAKARMLFKRGVDAGNDERWEQAIDDLREAYRLNPLPNYQKNLRIALGNYAAEAESRGHYTLAQELREEVIAIAREVDDTTARPARSPDIVEVSSAVPDAESPAVPDTFILAEHERYNPALFDEQGILCLDDAFTSNGRAVINQARAQAISAQTMLIGIPALVLALTNSAKSIQFFTEHRISPKRLRQVAEAALKPTSPELALPHDATLSQANFRPNLLKILDQAWEIAQYTWGFVDETHLLYSLLLSDAALLYDAGVDAQAIVATMAAPVYSILRGATESWN